MTRHSKNNTTSGSFTYAERQKLTYGTQSARCTADSLRPITHCFMCLQVARQPNCCPRGHLACRSCFLESVLSQKDTHKRHLAAYHAAFKAASEAENTLEAEKRVVDEKRRILTEFLKPKSGMKRSAADRELEISVNDRVVEGAPKEEICCSAGPHPLVSTKHLRPVQFFEISREQGLGCPVCLKPFQGNKLKVRIFPGCGHAACDACHQSLRPVQCFSCEEKLKIKASGKEKDNQNAEKCGAEPCELEECLLLESEGTGFAAGGGIVQVDKYDLAFQ